MDFDTKKVGILSLQGAFSKHQKMLINLGATVELIRYPEQLDSCDGLIIPGGESTTMSKIIAEMGFYEKLVNFTGAIFGTCAGAILLSSDAQDPQVCCLARVPLVIQRNAYGRQVDSFTAPVSLAFDAAPFKAVFIRAPRLAELADGVEVLGIFDSQPVLVQYRNNLVSTFHPELTEDVRIHRYFLNMIKSSK